MKLDGPDNLKKWTEIGQVAFAKPFTYVSKIKIGIARDTKKGWGTKTMKVGNTKNLESKLKNTHQASNLNKILQNYAAPPNRRYKVVSL